MRTTLMAAALVLLAFSVADAEEFVPNSDMPIVVTPPDLGDPILPVTNEPWHPDFSAPVKYGTTVSSISEVDPHPSSLALAQQCANNTVNISQYGMAAYDRGLDENCHFYGFGFTGRYNMPDPKPYFGRELPGWEDAFYRPKPENFVLPTVRNVQECIAYTMMRIETGKFITSIDKFCALRGLYVLRLDYLNRFKDPDKLEPITY